MAVPASSQPQPSRRQERAFRDYVAHAIRAFPANSPDEDILLASIICRAVYVCPRPLALSFTLCAALPALRCAWSWP